MGVSFTIDPRSGVPIYAQLVEQVKRSVAIGALAAGERLPTVKALAVDLTVNPNTVARAYRDLEREGVIETSPGRGSFVSGDAPATRRAVADVSGASFEAAVREAKAIGLSRAEVATIVERLLERWFGSEASS
ncbi:MAG: GntR family transcriptional regulator [Candidatus Velthaea sp.]